MHTQILKVLQGWTDLITTSSGLLNLFDSTYRVKTYLFMLLPLLWQRQLQPSLPLSLLFPPASGRAPCQVFYTYITSKCSMRKKRFPFYRFNKAHPHGRGRFETESVPHHSLWVFHCSMLSELLFIGHLLSSRHWASNFRHIFVTLQNNAKR